MKLLVTGSNGFVGMNLIAKFRSENHKVFEFDLDTKNELLNRYCAECDFVFHLAGTNRPENTKEFMQNNFGFTSVLLKTLKRYKNKCPVMLSSSIQAALNNPYGRSKKAGEELLLAYADETGAKVLIYRYPNIFGKWCRPNYNSVIATLCNNIAYNLPIQVNDPSITMNLVYIDDVVSELIHAMEGRESKNNDGFCCLPIVHTISLKGIVDLLYAFKASRDERSIPNMEDAFTKKLYATYLSYLPKDRFRYPLKMNCDNRGSFTEIVRTPDRGQFAVNILKPGMTKGNHWHHTKNEKFLVVSGKGVIRFRNILSNEVLEYFVCGNKLEMVDIPVGYTHNLENLGDEDLITFIWCNECFDPEKPDTYYLEV